MIYKHTTTEEMVLCRHASILHMHLVKMLSYLAACTPGFLVPTCRSALLCSFTHFGALRVFCQPNLLLICIGPLPQWRGTLAGMLASVHRSDGLFFIFFRLSVIYHRTSGGNITIRRCHFRSFLSRICKESINSRHLHILSALFLKFDTRL